MSNINYARWKQCHMTTIMLVLAINIHTKLNKNPIKRLLELRSENTQKFSLIENFQCC